MSRGWRSARSRFRRSYAPASSGWIAEPVAEREVSTLPLAAGEADVDLERPPPVVIAAEVLVLVAPRVDHPAISQRPEWLDVVRPRDHRADRRLDVDDRLRGKAGTEVEPTCSIRTSCSPSAVRNARGLGLVARGPARVVGTDRVGPAPALLLAGSRSRSAESREERQGVEEDCWGASCSAVSSGCHCTPSIQVARSSCWSGTIRSIASIRPSSVRPVTARPSPRRSIP